MNLRSINLILVALLAGALTASCSDPAEGTSTTATPFVLERPQIAADRVTAQFGTVVQGAVLTASYELEVTGEYPLNIRAFNRSCGCADVSMFVNEPDGTQTPVQLRHPYPPGTKFTLTGVFNTTDKRGPQKQYVQIEARDTEELLLYHIECDIVSFFEAAPLVFDIEGATSLGAGSATRRVVTRDGSAVRLSRGADGIAELALELVPVDPDDDGRSSTWDVTVSMVPGVPRGKLEKKLILLTDLPQPEATKRPEAERFHQELLYVRAQVEGAVVVEPESIEFSAVRTGQIQRRRFLVRNELDDFELPTASVTLEAFGKDPKPFARPDAVTVELNELKPGLLWQVDLEAHGDVLNGEPVRGYAVLPIGHPFEAAVRIPFLVQAARN